MRFENVSILSVAHVDAPHRIPSAELEVRLSPFLRRIGFAPGVIASLSGVVARRYWDEGTQPSEVAGRAAELALAKAGIAPGSVGLLVNTSVCRDFIEPSTACLVHARLGLPSHCLNFDVSNACLGFINGMDLVAQSIERGIIDYGLVVDGETSRFAVEKTIERLNATGDARAFADNFATLTLGSGAVAMLLARKGLVPDAHQYVGSVSLAATEHSALCRGQIDGMITNGQKLLQAGLELAERTFARAREELDWAPEKLDEVAIHQVSRQHSEKLIERLGLDPAKLHTIYPEFGNIGPASIPLVIAQADALGRLQKGHRIGMMGIGSGINVAMAEIVW